MPAGLTLLDDAVRLEQLFAPVAGVSALGLAVSGGADSLALMLLAARWAKTRAVRLVVYSVDHGLRAEAADEVQMVLSSAADLGLDAHGLVWAGRHPGTGVQAEARTARYRLMGEAMRRDGVAVLLTAHHRNDQAETVLMRLAHGSGLEGLKGMTAFSSFEGVRIFRPLLDVEPDELQAVVEAAGLRPAQDPSNHDTHYERVRWRGMLPQLAEMGLTGKRLADLARRLDEAQAVVAQAADAAERALVSQAGDSVQVNRAGFAALPNAVGVLLLSRLLARIGGSHKWRAIGSVEVLQRSLVNDASFRGRTLHGCQIRRGKAVITIAVEPGRVAKNQSTKAAEPSPT